MALQWSLFGDVAADVLSWLDIRQLACMETTCKEVDAKVTKPCWEILANVERNFLEWKPWLLQVQPKNLNGKETLKRLFSLKCHLNEVPENWSPHITAASPSSLRLLPRDVNTDGPSGEEVSDTPRIPPRAVVPVALGTVIGDDMMMGLHIQSNTERAHEGVWFGLELVGNDDGWGKTVSVRFAPLTGRAMIQFEGDRNGLITQLMVPLEDHLCGSVDVYVTVSEAGDVEFIRSCPAAHSVVRSGTLPHEMLFPAWAWEIFAGITISMDDVLSETTVSAKSSVGHVLEGMNQSAFTSDAIWALLE